MRGEFLCIIHRRDFRHIFSRPSERKGERNGLRSHLLGVAVSESRKRAVNWGGFM